MTTLLLRLAAPIQSWGDESKYNIRHTWNEPSKSGVIGLLAAALGLRRDSEEIAKLASKLRMGIRIEQPGTMLRDFHTALAPKYKKDSSITYLPNGKIEMQASPNVTERYYLCDACFLVGLESNDTELLKTAAEALQHPVFPLYLGRRACPPTLPLVLGFREKGLKEAIEQEPWQASPWYQQKNPDFLLRIHLETPVGQPARYGVRDQPVTFNPVHRQYSYRGLEGEIVHSVKDFQHDAMKELSIPAEAGK